MRTTLSNCNRCANTNCPKPDYQVSGINIIYSCPKWVDPTHPFPLIEIALSHPQHLHEALSTLPFEATISHHLRRTYK